MSNSFIVERIISAAKRRKQLQLLLICIAIIWAFFQCFCLNVVANNLFFVLWDNLHFLIEKGHWYIKLKSAFQKALFGSTLTWFSFIFSIFCNSEKRFNFNHCQFKPTQIFVLQEVWTIPIFFQKVQFFIN